MVSGALAPSMLIIVFAGTLKNILLSRVRIGWLLLEDFFRMNEFEELLNSVSEVSTGDVVTAEVISVDNDQANVVIEGTGIEGVLTRRELTNDRDADVADLVKDGETLEVLVLRQVVGKDTDTVTYLVSKKRLEARKAWDKLVGREEEVVTVKGTRAVKGGLSVEFEGLRGFIPASMIDTRFVRNTEQFVGQEFDAKIKEVDPAENRFILSRREVVEAEAAEARKEVFSKLEVGSVVTGKVARLTSFGAFIDLGGVDGLIHITDLSWGRVSDPKEVVELDQKLNVVILDFDDEKKRIALGLKQLTPHPWDALDANLQVGDKVKGKVVVMADYGAFIEIAPGVEGLIHVSEMSWSQHLRSAQDFMKVGDEVEAVILTLDRDERKMSLGIKQLKQDPWETIEEKYPVGSKHTAKVRNFTNFGVFVEIEEGVDGLIHISDLSWTKKVKHPSEFTQIGADIEVQVLEIDKENRRLSLGHKQLEENPWDVFETVFTVGSVHEGTIIEMLDKGAVVALPYGVEGFATPKHLVKEDGSQAQLDEKLSFKVIEFNKDAKRIILSHSRIFEDAAKAEERAEKKAASNAKKTTKREEAPAIQNQAASTTLGDIDALAALKEQLENKKK